MMVAAHSSAAPPDAALYDRARSQFAYFDPKLEYPIFMENAGGSQVSWRSDSS